MAGTRIVDLPDLGTPTDSASFVAEMAGSGRFALPALRTFLTSTVASNLLAETALRKGVRLSAMDGFGCIGNGTTDDTVALQAALNSLTHGGTLHLPAGYSFRVGNLTIPIGVTLEGPYPSGVGAPGMGNYSPPYNNMSWLRTNAGTTITLAGGGGLCGCLIAPYGMSFPQAGHASWTGTCMTGGGDDITIENCMAMGYAAIFYSTGKSRVRFRDCNFDALAGITVDNSTDVCRFDGVQFWPFAVTVAGGTDSLTRPGTAFTMTSCQDMSKFYSCFSYGYNCGYAIDGCGDVALIGCLADNMPGSGTGTGYAITGFCTQVLMSGCVAAAMINGYFVAATANGVPIYITDCMSHNCVTNGVLVDAANAAAVIIRGGYIGGSANGVGIQSAFSPVDIDGVYFKNIGTPAQIIHPTVATTNVRIGPLCNFSELTAGNAVSAGNLGLKAIASSDPLTLLPNFHFYNVTGTTVFGSLTGGWAGRVVTLIFQGALTVYSALTGVSAVMRLKNNVPFVTSTGATLTLMHNGTQWFEIGRSSGFAMHEEVGGTGTNDSAAAGFIGEIIEVTRVAGSAVSLTSGAATDLATIVLGAGDWDISGTVAFLTGGSMTVAQGWVAAASVTPPAAGNPGYVIMNATMGTGTQLPTGTQRFSLATSTTIYLSTLVAFTGTTVSAFGNVRARRVR